MEAPMKIVIGYDGSPAMDLALQDLRRAGLPSRLEATVLCAADVNVYDEAETEIVTASPLPVYSRHLSEDARALKEQALHHADAFAEAGARRVRSIFPMWNVQPAVRTESPAWALVEKADEWKADLIVVGAGGHSSLGRFLGSVSQLVIINAPCSVRIVRPRLGPPDQELRIVVGVDGSEGAAKAVAAMEKRNWPASTHIRVLLSTQYHALPELTHLVPPDLSLRATSGMVRRATRVAEEIAGRLRVRWPETTVIIEDGNPKKRLVENAEEWLADCVFVGARGLSPLKRFLLGSVSTAVAARSHCSVEVVR